MGDIIKLRRDTAANWASYNPILSLGEPGVETDTKRWKIGDGVTAWNSLAYRNEYSVFNVSYWNRTSNQVSDYARYATLASAISAIPAAFHQGGMSIKYIDSTTDEYVQYRYTAVDIGHSYFSNIANWVKEDVFASGQCISDISIVDSINNGSSTDVLSAKQGMEIGQKLKGITLTETKVNISDYTLQNGYIDGANGQFVSSTLFRTIDISVATYNNIRFCGLKRNDIYAPGYAIGYYDDGTWVPTRYWKYPTGSNPSILSDILVDIKEGETIIRITCRVYNTPLNENTFYAYLRTGKTVMEEIKDVASLIPFQIPSSSNYVDGSGVVHSTSSPSYALTDYYFVYPGLQIKNAHAIAVSNTYLAFYNKDFQFISVLQHSTSGFVDVVLNSNNIPAGAVYFRANINASYTDLPITQFYINRVAGIDFQMDENSSNLLPNSVITKATTYPITYTNKRYLGKNGDIITSLSTTFSVSDYCLALPGIKMYGLHAASGSKSDFTYVTFYNKNFNFVGRLRNPNQGKFNHTLTQEEIPEGAKYFKACVWHEENYDGYIDYRIPINLNNPINDVNVDSNTIPFDYSKALAMPKQQLQTMVEVASNGRCTVLYDDDNYPSLMYKIPKIGIGSLVDDNVLGGNSDVHPAFIVNGTEKDFIYLSVFEASNIDGHYVSWYGLPSKGSLNLYDVRESIANKGDGWHVETIYERSLLVLLTKCLNSPTPTGNTNKGRSHLHHYEYCQMEGGLIPGTASGQPTGNKWINGTQPSAWSHNKELWGIQDVIGGYHEICDLYKLVNSQIYIASDNKFFKIGDDASTFEDDWIATGVYYNVVNNQLVIDTSSTLNDAKQSNYQDIRCTSNYDAITLDLRKKLCLLLLSPVLVSSDNSSILGLTGYVRVDGSEGPKYGIFGGAEEYSNSGLGCHSASYNLMDSAMTRHGNMGCRLAFIG